MDKIRIITSAIIFVNTMVVGIVGYKYGRAVERQNAVKDSLIMKHFII